MQEYLFRNTSLGHQPLIAPNQDTTVPENESATEENKRLKPVADRLRQCMRRAAVVKVLGPVALFCSKWMSSRWFTHTRNDIWENTMMPFLEQQRDWLKQQSEEVLQIPNENIQDLVKSKNILLFRFLTWIGVLYPLYCSQSRLQHVTLRVSAI